MVNGPNAVLVPPGPVTVTVYVPVDAPPVGVPLITPVILENAIPVGKPALPVTSVLVLVITNIVPVVLIVPVVVGVGDAPTVIACPDAKL